MNLEKNETKKSEYVLNILLIHQRVYSLPSFPCHSAVKMHKMYGFDGIPLELLLSSSCVCEWRGEWDLLKWLSNSIGMIDNVLAPSGDSHDNDDDDSDGNGISDKDFDSDFRLVAGVFILWFELWMAVDAISKKLTKYR